MISLWCQESSCAACHSGGVNSLKTFQQNVDIVAKGKGSMPGFTNRLSQKEMEEVAQFVMDQTEQGWWCGPLGKAFFHPSGCRSMGWPKCHHFFWRSLLSHSQQNQLWDFFLFLLRQLHRRCLSTHPETIHFRPWKWMVVGLLFNLLGCPIFRGERLVLGSVIPLCVSRVE